MSEEDIKKAHYIIRNHFNGDFYVEDVWMASMDIIKAGNPEDEQDIAKIAREIFSEFINTNIEEDSPYDSVLRGIVYASVEFGIRKAGEASLIEDLDSFLSVVEGWNHDGEAWREEYRKQSIEERMQEHRDLFDSLKQARAK